MNAGDYQGELKGLDAAGILKWAAAKFGSRISLATSFGAEDQVLTDMWAGIGDPPRLFTLDTGRFFQETYDVMQATMRRYKLRCDVFAPDAGELARLVEAGGPNLFYESVEKRKECCDVRKTRPLARALAGLDAWITGLRREQAVTRTEVEPIEWDATHGLYKICPLFDWTEDRVWDYIREHSVPYNALHDKGFRSIGCAPCTRAVAPGEDVRSGRWWWEQPEHRECGLHNRPRKG
ncbi:MAG: phosphoadenylyl-sulfate reductase [Acidobacteriota bacterium]|nr:phosphoadenylyl-sulfate reductase [Acidobacteriota bacterium]